VLAATIGRYRVINLYVPNGQAPGSEKFAYKLKWLEALDDWLAKEAAAHPGLIVLGDFNVAPRIGTCTTPRPGWVAFT
jgi:exodeoxyribonuclease-3